ncbi:TonB-dependent receptor [Thalassotalea mangrovi]|uniref:TonB-dependent receptor n=1 Tax=Thalassotalea mangrovi TaxID=2572245 RepID=A0A4V5NTZ3_9GAMM|nr:TonB-dependent receptor [Thalassotalea mangrovi]TKB43834.1 TonB-dependent receptor [Thalassotalea mangrovi]
MFKRNLINSAVVASLALSAQQVIAAEDAVNDNNEADQIEIIEVTGIRGSLNKAMNMKRFNTQIVDSIVAEDIGKFPDNNVVEALQRVTGVQVTGRGGGEVSTVSIRGLNDVHTTVNGRDVFTGAGRAVALQDIPASLLSTVTVYKTRSASQVERGIAGSINIETHRPFNFDGSKVVLAGRGIYADQSEELDPNISMLASNRWDTDLGEVGALFNVSYVQTNYRDDDLVAGAAFPFFTANPPSDHQPYKIMNFGSALSYWQPGLTNGLPSAAGSTLSVDGDDIEYLLARDAVFGRVYEAKRERPAFNVSLQWAPRDDLELLAEAFYTGYRNEQQTTMWFTNTFEEDGNHGNLQIDTPLVFEGTNVVKERQVYAPNGFQSGDGSTGKTDSYLFAFGANWSATDDLTVKSEILYQQSDFETEFFAMRFDRKAYGLDVDFNDNNGMPGISFWDDPATSIDESDMSEAANWNSGTVYDNGGGNDGDALTFTVDADWVLRNGFIDTVKFGAKYEKRGAESYTREQSATSVMPLADMAQALADAGASGDGSGFIYQVNDYMDGRADVFDNYITANGLYLINNADAVRQVYGYERDATQTTFDIEETSYALYATAQYALGESISGEIGVRYVDYSQDMQFWDLAGNYDTASGGASEVLPSFVMSWNVTDDLVARAAYTETLRMPEFGQLNALQFWQDPLTDGVSYGTGTGGNPDLQPTHSKNYDLSLEWYFAEGSSLYGALFKRDIDGLVIGGSKVVRRVGDDEVERDYILGAPVNASDGELSGIEVGFLYFPTNLPGALDGLGLQASYTELDSKQTTSDFNEDGSVAAVVKSKMSGVSDSSYSVVGIYEKEQFDVRLSYVWREEFFQGNEASFFANPLQFWSRPEQSLDFQFSFDATENLVLTFDATNILDDVYRNYYGEGNDNLFNFGNAIYSRTFALGARYSF